MLVCTYSERENGIAYLKEMLRSVAKQDYPNLSLLLYSDGVSHEYWHLVQKEIENAKQNSFWLSGFECRQIENSDFYGRTKALDEALEIVKRDRLTKPYEYFGLIDSDDRLNDDTAISQLIERIQSTESDAAYSHRTVIDTFGNTTQSVKSLGPDKYTWSHCLSGAYPFHLSVWNTKLLKNVEIDTSVSHAVDYGLVLAMLEQDPALCLVDADLYAYRVHPDRMSSNRDAQVVSSINLVRESIKRRNGPHQARLSWVVI